MVEFSGAAMPRFAVTALACVFIVAGADAAMAADSAASRPTAFLSWPGKAGAPNAGSPAAGASAPVALPHQFFGETDDMAAPPPPLMPRSVPGTQAITSTATANTASNRARQTALITADSAADGPVAGAGSSN
jgi:hypothetical protein